MAAAIGGLESALAHLKTESGVEMEVQTAVLRRSLEIWRDEMSAAVANGISRAFKGK